MTLELIVFLIALLPVAARVWFGWRLGATVEIRHVLVYLFATLVAVRYWHELAASFTNLLPYDPRILAVAAYVLLFLVAGVICAVAVRIRAECYQSVHSNWLDHGLGAAFGVVSGALLGGAVVALVGLALSATPGAFDVAKLPLRIDRLPVAIFHFAEETGAGVSAGSSGRTLLPDESVDAEDPARLNWK